MPNPTFTKKAKELAQLFHETYERLAPEYGYETRPDTKEFDPNSPNGKLMIAVASVISLLHEEEIAKARIEARQEYRNYKYKAGELVGRYIIIEPLGIAASRSSYYLVKCTFCKKDIRKESKEMNSGHHGCVIKRGKVFDQSQLSSPKEKEQS